MRSPIKNGLSILDVESQYDSYLLAARGLSRSTRNLHHYVVHRLLSSRFLSGNIDWSKVRFNDFVQFLTSEFARLHNRATQTAWLMILRISWSRCSSCRVSSVYPSARKRASRLTANCPPIFSIWFENCRHQAGPAGESGIRLVIETRIAPECRAILK